MRALAAAALVALAAPGLARAEEARIVSRDLPVAGARSLAGAPAPLRFNLVGLHWQGTGTVRFRTRSVGGRWGPWRAAAPEDEDAPDRGSEASRRGWRVGNPYWTGRSDRIEYLVRGRVRRLRAWFVWSPPAPAPPRALALAGAPAITPRLSWRANEAIRRAPPSYASALRLAIVHHTAGSNAYSPAQSAAIVRAIQLYHVRGNGWNDIGYNFLVDKYGQVFEGRYGGIDRNVVGAHAEGFNTGSVGVAVLGDYGRASLTPAARAALVSLLAWRLDVAHVDPASTLTATSGGNARFPRGVPVFLRAIVGHREVGFTSCPGTAIFARLGEIASGTASTGLPKLYLAAVRGRLGGAVRFTARLSQPLPWTVTVRDASGRAVVASGAGAGKSVDWTWDASGASGRYSWTIAAGPAVRSATGTIGRAVPLPLLSRVRARPAMVSPDGDGRADVATIAYTLGTAATVTATLVDPDGAPLALLFSEPRPAGQHQFAFTPEAVPDGTYRILLRAAAADGRHAATTVPLVVSRALTRFAAQPRLFSPNGDRRRDRVAFRVELAAPAEVTLRVLRGRAPVATLLAGPLPAGVHAPRWGGRVGARWAAGGRYEAEVEVRSAFGTVSRRLSLRADVSRPVLRLVSLRPLRLRVSEAATIAVVADGRRRRVVARAGVVVIPLPRPRRLRAVAMDAAGNVGRPLRYP